MLFTDDAYLKNLANQSWLILQTMVAWGSRDFEKYLEIMRPLNLANMCISEGELSEAFGITWWRYGNMTY